MSVRSLLSHVFLLILLGDPLQGLASSPQDAVKAYKRQQFARCYRIALSLSKTAADEQKAQLLLIAAASALELDKPQKAKQLFKKAYNADPGVDLPAFIKSKRIRSYFEALGQGTATESSVQLTNKPDFDRGEIYLPLGWPQYKQDKNGLALLFGAGQLFPAYAAYTRWIEANKTDKETAAATRTAISTGNEINPKYEKFVRDNNDFAKKMRTEAQILVAVGLAAYAASVIEAAYHPLPREEQKAMTWNLSVAADPESGPLFGLSCHW